MGRKKPTTYPVVVEDSNKTASRVALGMFALCALALFVWAAASTSGFAWFLSIAGTVAGLCSLACWNGMATVYVVQPESISKTTLRGCRTVTRSAVVGLRSSEIASRTRLIAAEGAPLTVSARVRHRAEDWFAGIPDLDAEEIVALRQRLDSDPRLGANVQQRRRIVARTRRLFSKLEWGIAALLLWGLLYPKPYLLVITISIILPIVGLALFALSRGCLSLNALKNDPRPALDRLVLMPPLLLAMRALMDFEFLDLQVLAGMTAGIALAATVFLCRKYPVLKRGLLSLMGVFLFTWAWLYGAVAQADVQFDGAKPALFRTTVIAMHVSRGSKSTSYNVTVAPWGPIRTDETISVAPRTYNRLKIGREACVWLGGGALGMRWYDLSDC